MEQRLKPTQVNVIAGQGVSLGNQASRGVVAFLELELLAYLLGAVL